MQLQKQCRMCCLSLGKMRASETIEFSAGGNFLFKHFQLCKPCMYLCSCLISRVATLQIFPPKKVQGIPVLQNVPCKVHVIITGITCTPEIPAKIIRKFEKS